MKQKKTTIHKKSWEKAKPVGDTINEVRIWGKDGETKTREFGLTKLLLGEVHRLG